jgi:hypothetical protein
MKLLDPVAELDRRQRIRFSVNFNNDVEIRSDRLAHLRQVFHAFADRLAEVHRLVLHREKPTLDAGPAIELLLLPERDLLLIVLEATLLPVADPSKVTLVTIESHPVAGPTAEQPPDRQADRLAQDVPERDLDRTQRRHEHRSAPVARSAENVLEVTFDFGRVLADQVTLQLANRSGDGEALARQGALPQPSDALVGVDLDEDACRCRSTRKVFTSVMRRLRTSNFSWVAVKPVVGASAAPADAASAPVRK